MKETHTGLFDKSLEILTTRNKGLEKVSRAICGLIFILLPHPGGSARISD